jgi:hypothetical protein
VITREYVIEAREEAEEQARVAAASSAMHPGHAQVVVIREENPVDPDEDEDADE